MSGAGTMMSRASRSAKSKMLWRSSSCASGITPVLSAWSTSARSSSALRIVSPATTSSIPNGRRSSCADRCSSHTSGRSTRPITSTGRAISIASVSARSSASAFGTSSPSTTLRYVTIVNARTKLTHVGRASPRSSLTSGSATAPVTIPSAVIPT